MGREMLSNFQRGVVALFGTVSLTGAMGLPSMSFAQDLRACECVTARGASAMVREVKGRVLISQAAGLVPAGENAPVRVPGRVVTGPQSSSLVVVGDGCEVRVGANQSAEIRGEGGQLCLRLTDNAPQGLVPAGGIPPVVPLTLLGLGGVGILIFAITDEDNKVSQ